MSGFHIQFIDVTKDESGQVVFSIPLNPQPVGDKAFPLSDAMRELNTSALLEVQRLSDVVSDLSSQIGELKKTIESDRQLYRPEKEKKSDELRAMIADAQVQLDALQT